MANDPKTAMDILGPGLAALVTGAALIYQGFLTARRDANARKENALREREREDRALAEAHKREVAAARTEWATTFQEAVLSLFDALQEWKKASLDPVVSHRVEGIEAAVKRSRTVQTVAHVATAKLLTIERDPIIRATAFALSTALGVVIGGDGDPKAQAAAQEERLANLLAGLNSLTDRMVGLPSNDNEIMRNVVAGSLMAPAQKARVLEAIDKSSKALKVKDDGDG